MRRQALQRRSIVFAWLVLLGALAPDGAFGQAAPTLATSIVGQGAAEATILPTKLRLSIEIKAQAKDSKAALEALKARKEQLSKELGEMKADVATLRFEDTMLSESVGGMQDDDDHSRQRMQMMMRMNRRNGGGPAIDMDELPKSYLATCEATVDWTLPAKFDTDSIALLMNRLKDEITKRRLEEAAGEVELSDDEKEAMDMFREESSQYGFSSDEKQGPMMYLVAIASPEEKTALLKQAFERAMEDVRQLAEASGMRLGRVTAIQKGSADFDMASRMYAAYNQRGRRGMDRSSMSNQNEVLGQALSDLKLHQTITVTFAIE